MMVYFRKRLREAVVNYCNERIMRHSLAVIKSTALQNDHDDGGLPQQQLVLPKP